jgi:hypothetical protein
VKLNCLLVLTESKCLEFHFRPLYSIILQCMCIMMNLYNPFVPPSYIGLRTFIMDCVLWLSFLVAVCLIPRTFLSSSSAVSFPV